MALAASVVVALAVSGHGLLAPPLALTPTGTWLVRLAGVLALAGGVAVMVTHAERIRPPGTRGPDPTIDALRTAAGLMAAVTLLAFLNPTPAPPEETPATAPPVRLGAPSSGPDRAGDASSRARPPRGGPAARGSGGALGGASGAAPSADQRLDEAVRPGLLSVIGPYLPYLILAAIVWFTVLMLRRRTVSLRALRPPELPPALGTPEADDEVEEPRADPWRSGRPSAEPVTSAYQRMLDALARAGVSVRPEEAPHEYLDRVLLRLALDAAPLRRLTDLYLLAQFSGRPPTDGHRTEATRVVDAVLNQLDDTGSRPAPGVGA